MKINVLILFIGLAVTGFAQQKSELPASKAIGKVPVKGKKTYTYYALSEKSKAEFKVNGPGILYVNTRVRLPEGQFSSQAFRVKCVRSGEHVSFFDVPELLASNQKFSSSSLTGIPSRSFRYVIHVPPGKQVYRLYKDKTDQKANVRVFYEAHPKPKWMDVSPLTALKKVDLRYIKSGKERSYTQLHKGQSFLFSITDTTRLRILIRPEFSYRMLDESIFKVKLTNTITLEETVYKLNARKSKRLEYAGMEDKIPGTLNTIYLDLPSADSDVIYELSLLGGTKAVAVRISKDQNLANNLMP